MTPCRIESDRGIVKILVNEACSGILSRSPSALEEIDWRAQLRQAFRRPGELLAFLGLDGDSDTHEGNPTFPMLVPRAYANRMQRGNRHDPLLLQVLPNSSEQVPVPGFISDPVGDGQSRQARGLLHKYHGRALVISTGACAVHCRYCFRQHYPYANDHAGRDLKPALAYIEGHPDITEVILSGGDPLMLDTARLGELSHSLSDIEHIKRLRIHTRLPVVLPDRVDKDFCAWMGALPWPVVVVIHANHAAEFDSNVDGAASRMRAAGAHLFNQSVLLRGINDHEDSLVELMERSFAAGVVPYYLHMLDRVEGAARFDISIERALQLHERLRLRLPGYLVPRLVREQAGAPYKLPVL